MTKTADYEYPCRPLGTDDEMAGYRDVWDRDEAIGYIGDTSPIGEEISKMDVTLGFKVETLGFTRDGRSVQQVELSADTFRDAYVIARYLTEEPDGRTAMIQTSILTPPLADGGVRVFLVRKAPVRDDMRVIIDLLSSEGGCRLQRQDLFDECHRCHSYRANSRFRMAVWSFGIRAGMKTTSDYARDGITDQEGRLLVDGKPVLTREETLDHIDEVVRATKVKNTVGFTKEQLRKLIEDAWKDGHGSEDRYDYDADIKENCVSFALAEHFPRGSGMTFEEALRLTPVPASEGAI